MERSNVAIPLTSSHRLHAADLFTVGLLSCVSPFSEATARQAGRSSSLRNNACCGPGLAGTAGDLGQGRYFFLSSVNRLLGQGRSVPS